MKANKRGSWLVRRVEQRHVLIVKKASLRDHIELVFRYVSNGATKCSLVCAAVVLFQAQFKIFVSELERDLFRKI